MPNNQSEKKNQQPDLFSGPTAEQPDYTAEVQRQTYEAESSAREKGFDAFDPTASRTREILLDPSTWDSAIASVEHGAKAFSRGLADTIRVKLEWPDVNLDRWANVTPAKRRGAWLVRCRFGAVATIYQDPDKRFLIIEVSVVKWLTGQNLIGILSIRRLCRALLKQLLQITGVIPPSIVRRRIKNYDYDLLRVDIAMHCDCFTEHRANIVMIALRDWMATAVPEFSSYRYLETLYSGQHSRSSTLCVYLKGREVLKNPMHLDTFRREYLMERAKTMVRFELTLRSTALRDKGLNRVDAWTKETALELIKQQIDRLTPLHSVAVDLAGLDKLEGITRERFRLWLLGVKDVFNQAAGTRNRQRKVILEATGVDINSPFSVERQAQVVQAAQTILRQGLHYGDRSEKWDQLTNPPRSL